MGKAKPLMQGAQINKIGTVEGGPRAGEGQRD